MRHLITPLALAACLGANTAKSTEVTNAELEQFCAQKTIVTGYDEDKKITQIGESIDGFCAGYIRATFESFSSNEKCDAAGSNLDFLLSVYSHYLKMHKVDYGVSARKTLITAFSRIPDCNTSKAK